MKHTQKPNNKKGRLLPMPTYIDALNERINSYNNELEEIKNNTSNSYNRRRILLNVMIKRCKQIIKRSK